MAPRRRTAVLLSTTRLLCSSLQLPSRPPDFAHRALVKVPLRRVVSFYDRPDILQVLTPPVIAMTTSKKEPIAEQSVNEFTLSPFFLGRIPWVARHSDVERTDKSFRFTDVQEVGPMQLWIHRHDIEEQHDGTVILDSIWLEHGTFWTRLLFGLPNLAILFWYRELITNLYLGLLPGIPPPR